MTIQSVIRRPLCAAAALAALFLPHRPANAADEARHWADWVEPNFPFYSSELDARAAGPVSTPDNLTPRGVILPLGEGVQVCFDLDLLRVSAVWTGPGLTPVSMARSSYEDPYLKSDVGEETLPKPIGTVWAANGIYPGWQLGDRPSQRDPRPPANDPREVGRGPLAPEQGRFKAIALTRGGARLEYTVGGVAIRERLTAVRRGGAPILVRWLEVGAADRPLLLVLSRELPSTSSGHLAAAVIAADAGSSSVAVSEADGLLVVKIAPHASPLRFGVALAASEGPPDVAGLSAPSGGDAPAAARWPQTVSTSGQLAPDNAAYVVDRIPVPQDNPWRREVRASDVQFFRDGTAAVITMDGDVWMVAGLAGDLGRVRWRRFASGLHEPLNLAVRGGDLFVYDRGGIWRLRDTTGGGEADRYELYSNVFPQSADTREYPSAMKVGPDGSFYLAKGGLAATYIGKLNGTVIRVSPDGASYEVLGWGFRQPFLGVNPRTGLVTVSDQEGRYVPSTPLYALQPGRNLFHGFLSPFQPKEQYPAPIADPLTWIPHTVVPSAITQVWPEDARMGPLDGALLLLAFSNPGIYQVLFDPHAPLRQAAVVEVTHDFPFPPLSAGMNPADGFLYVAGFKGMGAASPWLSGLARVRYTGLPDRAPSEVEPMDRGILLRFRQPLDPRTAADPRRYHVARWNYRRAWTYGSLQYRLDGAVGQDDLPVASAYLSSDGRSIFLGVPDLRTGVMQMDVGWSVSDRDGAAISNHAYFTPFVLTPFDAVAEGFGSIDVNLRVARSGEVANAGGGLVAEGARLYQALGCMACHSTDGSPRVGPSWKGLYGSTVRFGNGSAQRVDDAYIRRHLGPHPDETVPGFEPGAMPNYSSMVNDAQVAALVAFIKSIDS